MGERLRKNTAVPFIVGVIVLLALTTAVQEEVPDALDIENTAAERAVGDKTGAPVVPAPKPQAVQVAGTQVQVDPQTGKLIPPTPAQRKSLAQALRKQFTSDPYGPYYFADGTISFVVGTERLNFSLARLNEKGLPEMSCVSGLEQAVQVLEGSGQQAVLRAEE